MKYGNEGLDCKKYFLLFLGKVWIVILAAAAGAALGAGIYWFMHVAINSNREYRAESKIYLDFASDESGEIYQAYNGYTWNDLMSTEPILNGTMSYLPDGYTREEVTAATSAQILSDIRLLTITITTDAPDKANEILKATDLSLVDLGKREKEFTDIRIYKETEAELVVADSRLMQAILLGSVLALLAALFAMALIYVLDDKIYVPGDFKVITGLPFAGFCFTPEEEANKEPDRTAGGSVRKAADKRAGRSTGKTGREQSLAESLRKDCEQNSAYLEEKYGTLITFKIEKKQQITKEERIGLQKAEGILLAVPYGKMDKTTLNYRIEQLQLWECKVVGILIQDADMRYMKWYYNHF